MLSLSDAGWDWLLLLLLLLGLGMSSRTTRMETVAWRFWTRVTRARTMESTAGRVLYLSFLGFAAGVVGGSVLGRVVGAFRETVNMDFNFMLGCAGLMTTGPGIDAYIWVFRTCVPGPAEYEETGPRRWPGIAKVG